MQQISVTSSENNENLLNYYERKMFQLEQDSKVSEQNITSLQQQYSEIQIKCINKEKQNIELQMQLDAQKNEIQQNLTDKTNLENQLKLKNNQLQATLNNFTNYKKETDPVLQKQIQELEQLNLQKNTLSNQIQVLQSTEKLLLEDQSKQKIYINELYETNKKLEDALTKDQQNWYKQKGVYEEQIHKLQENLKKYEDLNINLNEKILKLEQESQSTQKSGKDEIDQLRQELLNTKKTDEYNIQDLQNQNEGLRQQQVQYLNSFDTLQTQYTASKAEIQKLQDLLEQRELQVKEKEQLCSHLLKQIESNYKIANDVQPESTPTERNQLEKLTLENYSLQKKYVEQSEKACYYKNMYNETYTQINKHMPQLCEQVNYGKKVTHEFMRLKELLEQQMKEVKKLKADYSSLKQEFENVQILNKDLKGENNDLNSKILKIYEFNKKLKESMLNQNEKGLSTQLVDEEQKLSEEHQQFLQQLQQSKQQISQLNFQIQDLDTQKKDLEQNFQAQIDKLVKEKQQVEAYYKQQIAQLENCSRINNSILNSQITVSKQAYTDPTLSEIQSESYTSLLHERNDLKRRLLQTKFDFDQYKSEYKCYYEKFQTLQSSLDYVKCQYQNLQALYDQSCKLYQESNKKLESIFKGSLDRNINFDQTRKENITLQCRNQFLENKFLSIECLKNSIGQENLFLQKQRKILQDELQEKQKQLSEVMEKYNQQKISIQQEEQQLKTSLEKEIVQIYEHKYKSLECQNQQLNQQVDDLKRQIEKQNVELTEMKAEKTLQMFSSQKKNRRLSGQESDILISVEDIAQENLLELRNNLAIYKQQYEQRQKDFSDKLNQMQEKYNEVEKNQFKYKNDAEKLKEEKISLENEILTLKTDFQIIQNNIESKYKSEIEKINRDWTNQVKNYQEQTQKLEQTNKQYELDFQKSKDELALRDQDYNFQQLKYFENIIYRFNSQLYKDMTIEYLSIVEREQEESQSQLFQIIDALDTIAQEYQPSEQQFKFCKEEFDLEIKALKESAANAKSTIKESKNGSQYLSSKYFDIQQELQNKLMKKIKVMLIETYQSFKNLIYAKLKFEQLNVTNDISVIGDKALQKTEENSQFQEKKEQIIVEEKSEQNFIETKNEDQTLKEQQIGDQAQI